MNKLIDISELTKILGLKSKHKGKSANYILRYWETQFSQIKPIILNGNRRYYNVDQVKKIKFIKYLLKERGLTIKGAKKMLNKKDIDVNDKNNIEKDYFKNEIINKSKSILEKIKKIKKYG